MAKQTAGDSYVDLMGASIVQQCLKAGLVDEIQIDLAPLLLGSGVRLFDHLGTAPIALEQLDAVKGIDVTHVRYRLVK